MQLVTTNASLIIADYIIGEKKFRNIGEGPATPEMMGDANYVVSTSSAANVNPIHELNSNQISILSQVMYQVICSQRVFFVNQRCNPSEVWSSERIDELLLIVCATNCYADMQNLSDAEID